MKHILLTDALPEEALVELQALVNDGKCRASDFRPITRRYAKELLAKGLDADYLAYALEYLVSLSMRGGEGANLVTEGN